MVLIDNPSKLSGKYRVDSPRLPNWDYSTPGYYFITICTYNHNNFFGKIINNKMELSKMGIIAKNCLIDIPKHFKNIILDEYVVMPNHVHILLNLSKPLSNSVETHHDASLSNKNSIKNNKLNNLNQSKFNSVETHHDASLSIKYNNYYFHRIAIRSSQTIPLVIKQFKSAVTKQINPKTIFFAWQPRFHDEIIKDQKQLLIIKNYIQNNIVNWEKDKIYSL